MSRTEEVFIPAIQGRKIPILTLDHKWHRLFTQVVPNAEVKRLEKEMNELLKRQGKLTTETKDIKKIKNKLMDDIVSMMDSEEDDSEKSLDEKKRLIAECNDKLDKYQDEALELPAAIGEVNRKLMLVTMELCYDEIRSNNAEIEEISDWINEIRNELKKKVIRKQEKQIRNQEFYSYMHDIFGADVIDIFDMKYIPAEIKPKEAETKNETEPKSKNE